MRKNCSSDQENFLQILGLQPRIITRTIYSNSERSEQFLVTEGVPGGTIQIQIGILRFRNMLEKLEKIIFYGHFRDRELTFKKMQLIFLC